MARHGSFKNIAAAGIAALALSAVFNSAANANPALDQNLQTPAPSADVTITPPSDTPVNNVVTPQLSPQEIKQQALNEALLDEITGWGNRFTEILLSDGDIDPAKDQRLDQAIAGIKQLLSDGADPNAVSKEGVSAFHWSIWSAYKLNRLDLLEAFLASGADIKKADGAGWAPIDHALMALRDSQLSYLQQGRPLQVVETAATLVKTLRDAGAGLDTAQGLAGALQGKTFLDLAYHPVTALVFRDTGLISIKEYQERMEISDKLKAVARNLQILDQDFLAKYKAPIIDYPDAPPGGPEPYAVEDGDTLWNIAERFQDAMDAKSVLDAYIQIARQNNIALDDQNVAKTDVKKGDKLMIPVPVHHQIGNSELSPVDPLFGVAVRIMDQTGHKELIDVVQDLARSNSLIPGPSGNLAQLTAPGYTLRFTKSDGTAGTVTVLAGDGFRGFAERVRSTMEGHESGRHKAGVPLNKAMEELAQLNKLNLADIESGKQEIKPGTSLWVNFYNDGFDHIQELAPPATKDGSRRVDLIIIEDKDYHGKRTFGVTTNSGYAINRDLDMSQFHSWDENLFQYPGTDASDALRILMNLNGSPLQDKVVFSFSMAMAVDYVRADAARQARGTDAPSYETIRRNLEWLEQNKPIIFAGAGNWREDIRGQKPGDEHYVQSWLAIHSPRAVNVGSTGIYPRLSGTNATTISPYSSHGADICATLPRFLGNQMEGTSFSTPETATIYRQFSEWYGNVLTFEEIMAVGMMVTDLNILDHDSVDKVYQTMPDGSTRAVPARYKTNGAGLQVHDRCGAGNINFENIKTWNEMLKKMVGFKMLMDKPGEFKSQKIEFGDPARVITKPDGTKEYVYEVKIPENLTLGKLTFLLPQEKNAHSEVYVKSPTGFEKHLPKSLFDVVSTTAFNYEDVKAGQAIEIRTAQPFGKTAGVYLRGHEDGNVIQIMREYLQQQKMMLPALQNYDQGTLDMSTVEPNSNDPNNRNKPATAKDPGRPPQATPLRQAPRPQ